MSTTAAAPFVASVAATIGATTTASLREVYGPQRVAVQLLLDVKHVADSMIEGSPKGAVTVAIMVVISAVRQDRYGAALDHLANLDDLLSEEIRRLSTTGHNRAVLRTVAAVLDTVDTYVQEAESIWIDAS